MTTEKGNRVFVRTVGYHYIGEIVACDYRAIWLNKASWVADSGRWNNALKTGELSEVEPYPESTWPIEVPRGVILDACLWPHDCPTEVK